MGKTKTAFVSDTTEVKKEKKNKKDKVHLAGQKGGERVNIIDATPIVTEQTIAQKKKGPKVRGKKFAESKGKVDRARIYSAKDAVALARETSYSKFDGTMELHLVVKKEGLSTNVELPHAAGKAKKIEIANEDTVKKLESGKIDFDILLATPEMMPKLVPYARLLGPRGMMPNPKNGTVIKDKKDADKFNAARVTLKTEKTAPLIHTTIGKVSMKETELLANLEAILNAVNRRQITKAYVKATMGPSVKVVVE